jgi:putative oxidoreductase
MDNLLPTLNAWQPRILSVLRIMAALLLLQHGLVKMFGFPTAFPMAVAPFSLLWFAALIEIVCGLLILIGFMTRPAAFLLAGTMAAAYFMGHAGRGFYPIANGGTLAALYCFTFLYLVFAGPGPWSVDAQRSNKY